MEEIRISAGTLAEEWGRRGDLNRLSGNFGDARAGIRAHRRIQKSRPSGYMKEVPVKMEVSEDDISIVISGRIDGVLPTENPVLIEEIKTTHQDLEGFASREKSVHWSQAMLYAYLYAVEHNQLEMQVQVTCASLLKKKAVEERRSFTIQQLEDYFTGIISEFIDWQRRIRRWRNERDESLKEAPFPFDSYRAGQRDLAVASWKTLTSGKQLLVQSPTGTGKTVASLYPALKAFPSGEINRVIYLTARTTGQEVAQSCLDLIRDRGGRIKAVTLSARERICPGTGICTGDECELAKGYFDRLAKARLEFFEGDSFTRTRIEEISAGHQLCPYAFSRELHRWADCVICDFNYVFDPTVAAGLLPGDLDQSSLIVDEAHNLPDRARENFSAVLELSLLNSMAGILKRRRRLHNLRKKTEALFLEVFTPGTATPTEPDPEFVKSLRDLVLEIERILVRDSSMGHQAREKLFGLWCELSHFLQVAEIFGPAYRMLRRRGEEKKTSSGAAIKLFCMDPSAGLREALDGAHSALFLSGTLRPMQYYRRMLGCREDAHFLELPSPYPPENLCALVFPSLSTRYLDRENSAASLAATIAAFVNSRKGNFLVYFPSYAYLQMTANLIRSGQDGNGAYIEGEVFRQEAGMSEQERLEFLARFSEDNSQTLVGLAVMGGIFGEGIDLVGERLSGVAVVGVGLPAISDERESIKGYFDQIGIDGFNFSYLIPGMTRVLQAAGRVIRSGSDRGAILLIDDRFERYAYKSLFPSYWNPSSVRSRERLKSELEKFWGLSGKMDDTTS